DFHEPELADPSDLTAGRIVLLVADRPGSHEGGLRRHFDVRAARTDAGKTSAKGQEQPGIAFEANLSREYRHDQTALFRHKTQPGFRVRRDMDARFANQPLLEFECAILNPDRDLALFRSDKCEVVGRGQSMRLVGLENMWQELEKASDGTRS